MLKDFHSGSWLAKFFRRAAAGMLFLMLCLSARSQSFYYFENKISPPDKPAVTYHSFMTVFADGRALARIRYQDAAGENSLYELQFADSVIKGLNDNSTDKYLIPSQAPVLIAGKEDPSFMLTRFGFRQMNENGQTYYQPYISEYRSADDQWHKTELVTITEKSATSLTKEKDFVGIFYNEEEEFYKYLFSNSTRGPLSVVRKEKLFLVLVVNTKDSAIGKNCERDLEKVDSMFSLLAGNVGLKAIVTRIYGNAFSKQAVEKAIADLKPSPIDIVVFYYSGHGFRYSTDSSKYPRMTLRTSKSQDIDQLNMPIEDVYNKITKLGARMNLVIADCCSADFGANPSIGRDILRSRSVGVIAEAAMLNRDNLNALFFPPKPVSILVSSTEPNQLASCNPTLGSFFTYYFKAALDNSLYGPGNNRSWIRLLLDVKEKARYQALTAVCPDNNRCKQTAAIKVDPPQ